jgi:hypothetical protein
MIEASVIRSDGTVKLVVPVPSSQMYIPSLNGWLDDRRRLRVRLDPKHRLGQRHLQPWRAGCNKPDGNIGRVGLNYRFDLM